MRFAKKRVWVISGVIAACALLALKFSKQMAVLAGIVYITLASIWLSVSSGSCIGEFDEKATAIVEGVRITVGLKRSHAFLGEHKRYLWLDDGECMELGTDPGGYAHVNVFSLPDRIVIQTFAPEIVVLDMGTKAHHTEKRPLSEEETDAFAGKFHYNKERCYSFSTKEEDAGFDPYVLRGG